MAIVLVGIVLGRRLLPAVVRENFGDYLHGTWLTVQLTALSFAFAMVVGVAVAACRVSPIPPLRAVATAWVELVRNTPVAVSLLIFVYGFTKIGIKYSAFTSSVIVLTAYTSTYIGETVRSGINSVSKGQAEAARSLGLTFPQTLSLVVLPQALRTVVAPLGSLFIALVKNSSVAAIIAVSELTFVARTVDVETAQPVAAYAGAATIYVILAVAAARGSHVIERRAAIRR